MTRESRIIKRVAYFAAADDGPIKIGASCNVKRRLRELRTKTKMDLRILAVADHGIFAEMRYHSRFAEHRLEGEWFTRHPDILAEIARLTPPAQVVGREG